MNLHLEQHKKRKETLLALLDRAKNYFTSIDEEQKASSVAQFTKALEEGDFSIVVVGEFSAGKSTFLNALMGDRYLPSFTSETTATINFLKHRSKSPNEHTLQIDYKDPSVPVKFAEATKESIAKNVSTLGGDKVVQDIESVTLYLDSPLLEQGITLVDSPGLNGIAKGHAEVTERQIERSHACIYMFAASQPGSKSDFEVLAKLSQRFENIFLVLNQIDKIKQSEETVESVVDRLRENYLTYFPDHQIPEIFPIASYPALVSRTKEQLEYPDNSMQKNHDEQARARFLTISRIEGFEQRLWKFVTDGEKTIKELKAPAEMLQYELQNRMAFIKETLASLEGAKDADQIQESIEAVEADLKVIRENLEAQKSDLQLEIKELVADVENSAKAQIAELRESLGTRLNDFTDLDSIQAQIERINRQINRECEAIIGQLNDEFTSSLRKKMNSKYKEVALLANEKIEEASEETNGIRTLAFETNTNIEISMDDYEDKTKELEVQMETLRQKTEDTSLKKLEAMKTKRQLEKVEKQMMQVREDEHLKLSFLGERPTVERHRVQSDVKEGRGGLFGFIGNIFVGKKTVVKTSYEEDNSAQVKYDEERERIRTEFTSARESLDRMQQELAEKKNLDPEFYEVEQQRIEHKQYELQQKREQYIKEYGDKMREEQKKALKKIRYEFEDYVTEIGRDITKTVRANLQGKEKQLASIIVEALEKQFQKQTADKEANLKELEQILQSGEEERGEKAKALLAEKEQLKDLARDVMEFLSEIDSIQIDVIEHVSKDPVA